ncbi:MAG: hypothetical protein ACK5L3_14530, partial [Oscillospiraceae bacterium]
MQTKKQQAARRAMAGWLRHPAELGREPARLQCTGQFALYGGRYYIFRFKKSLVSKWRLGVCGGCEGEEPEHEGQAFSTFAPYAAATAEQQAKAMVEMIRGYWIKRAQEYQRQTPKRFAGPVAKFCRSPVTKPKPPGANFAPGGFGFAGGGRRAQAGAAKRAPEGKRAGRAG